MVELPVAEEQPGLRRLERLNGSHARAVFLLPYQGLLTNDPKLTHRN